MSDYWERDTGLVEENPTDDQIMAHLRAEGCTCDPLITVDPDRKNAVVRHGDECGFRR